MNRFLVLSLLLLPAAPLVGQAQRAGFVNGVFCVYGPDGVCLAQIADGFDLEGSTITNILDDEVFVGTGAGTGAFTAIPNCNDTTGKLDWTGTAFACVTDQTGAGSGETNTASNLGGGLANYSTKVGVDLQFNSFDAADFDLASNLISIDATKWAKLSDLPTSFAIGGDGSGTTAALVVTDDSHAHTGSTISGLDAGTDFTSGTMPTARLGSGTANGSSYLRGDPTWATPPAGA